MASMDLRKEHDEIGESYSNKLIYDYNFMVYTIRTTGPYVGYG